MTTGRFTPGRIAAIGALIAALVVAGWILLGPSSGNTYKLELQNGGQLVKGNQILVGGVPVGSIKSVELADNSQAVVTFDTDRTLNEGTTAVVRSTSLSGVANRYVSLTPGPDNFPPLNDGALITAEDTTSAVDLDELFNTLDAPTRKALQDVIQGSAATYEGRGAEANDAYKYFSPALSASDRLFRELGRDEQTLSEFVVNSSRVVTAVAARRDDLAALIPNANQALGAVAAHNRSLDQALEGLPPTLRQANTTFSNLRDALDSLDPLVATSKTATKDLAPFLRRVHPVTKKAVPVFTNLALAVRRGKPTNDLAEALRDLPGLQSSAASAMQPAIDAMVAANPVLKFARPYMPDVLGLITKLGQITAYYDADGHYARIQPAAINLFHYNQGTQFLEPIPASQQFNGLDFDIFKRCPGGASQASVDGSSPFLDNGNLVSPGDCNVNQVPPGP
ncbi:MAG: MlaD family protein [Solirubrobacterales bacterium]